VKPSSKHGSQDTPQASWIEEMPSAAPVSHGKVHRTERWLAKRLLEASGNAPISLLLWDGSEVLLTSGSVVGRLRILDRRALRKLVANPDFEFGELYTSGRIEVEGDLAAVLESVYRSQAAGRGWGVAGLVPSLSRRASNTPSRTRENIRHHYDIGNEFYRLWLDQQMVYTCAYYPTGNETLEEAQTAKLDYVCRKLRLMPGERVAESGCGWGALALHMARHYGVRVQAWNLSAEQIRHARDRARREGLEDRVEFIEDDYRNIRGSFDVFVSVGMLEHVGVANYAGLGALIDRVLTPGGRGLIHSIGRDFPLPMNSWIERRIFPGAQPPAISEMMALFEPAGFSVLDLENLRLHYARTLEQWLARYEQAAGRVREMYDETFVRAWRLYLASSLAAFRSGTLQLFQVVFTRNGNNDIPWTRAALYRDGE
jgi:cyclopropane-fatty-acyl-phospholipid synthase